MRQIVFWNALHIFRVIQLLVYTGSSKRSGRVVFPAIKIVGSEEVVFHAGGEQQRRLRAPHVSAHAAFEEGGVGAFGSDGDLVERFRMRHGGAPLGDSRFELAESSEDIGHGSSRAAGSPGGPARIQLGRHGGPIVRPPCEWASFPAIVEQCMRICKVGLLRIAAASLILVVAYSALLCVPEPFFSFSVISSSTPTSRSQEPSVCAAHRDTGRKGNHPRQIRGDVAALGAGSRALIGQRHDFHSSERRNPSAHSYLRVTTKLTTLRVLLEWDDRKAAQNVAKHGVPFDYAARIFLDPHRLDSEDSPRDCSEERRSLSARLRGGFLRSPIHRAARLSA
jgi:uncharacterized DUF497 family protein